MSCLSDGGIPVQSSWANLVTARPLGFFAFIQSGVHPERSPHALQRDCRDDLIELNGEDLRPAPLQQHAKPAALRIEDRAW